VWVRTLTKIRTRTRRGREGKGGEDQRDEKE
jgi:hypothetical protein